ncbi:MAG: GPP34 family phosphoprotein [Pirellulaceae bacterium]
MTTERMPIYQEYLLLALQDKGGNPQTGMLEYALAAAIIADLFLLGKITLDDKSKLIDVIDLKKLSDPILNSVLHALHSVKRRANLMTWISRVAGTKNLRRDVALELCKKGILKAERSTILLIFSREVFPEINSVPEKKIIERLRKAIFFDHDKVEPHTAALIALANSTGLLPFAFDRAELKARKQRIKRICEGEMIGKAAQDVILAAQAALMTSMIIPIIIS